MLAERRGRGSNPVGAEVINGCGEGEAVGEGGTVAEGGDFVGVGDFVEGGNEIIACYEATFSITYFSKVSEEVITNTFQENNFHFSRK